MRGSNATVGAMSGRPKRHESFLAFGGYRYLGLAALLSAASLALYILDRPFGTRYGGTWAGYTLGTLGALLILWLAWFGYRKRSYAKVEGRLVERLSAHVYFGLALVVIATLHTGFHFGWNVHTLAYALMCVVIVSGLCGVFCYVRYPRLMTANRAGMTLQQMLASVATLDEQLRGAALPLDETAAMVVERAIETNGIGGSTWRQLTRRYPRCTTAAAVAHFEAGADAVARVESDADTAPDPLEESWRQVRVLLDEKAALLTRVRRDISYKAMLDFWLYFHVPVTVMLLAALFVHIVSVFFLW
jgi:hypothetical protein